MRVHADKRPCLAVVLLLLASAAAASDIAPASIEASTAACPSDSLSQTTDCAPAAISTPGCGSFEISYYRRLPLTGASAGATVSGVLMAITQGWSPEGGDLPATLALYSIPSGAPFTLANLTLLASSPFLIAHNTFYQPRTIPIVTTITNPASIDLVVELKQHDYSAGPGQRVVLFGANTTGTAPTYIRAPVCGYSQPTNLATYFSGYPTWGLIASVLGQGLSERIFANGFE